MKRTIGGDQVAVAGGGDVPAGGVVPEAARRPLRELPSSPRTWGMRRGPARSPVPRC
jgi:hypothetical protein